MSQLETLNTAKRLLTIESYIEEHFQVDVKKRKNQKYNNTYYLGLVLITYKKLFGDQRRPVPQTVYSKLMHRNRSTAISWERRANEYLDVYKTRQEMYKCFLEEHSKNIYDDCNTNGKLSTTGYIKIISDISKEQLALLNRED